MTTDDTTPTTITTTPSVPERPPTTEAATPTGATVEGRDDSTKERAGRRRLQGVTVFDRVQREVLKLRRVIEGYRQRREPEHEDAVTKNVFDALDDLSTVSAELQGIVEVLEHVVHEGRPDPFAALREQKRKKALRRRGDRNADVPRFKVSRTARREAGES